MKLPPAQTSGVASLGRLSTALPGKVYRAQSHAIQSFQNAMDTFGQLGVQIYEQNAAAEHSKLRSQYMDQMNSAQSELEREPYRQDPDTGELISRHTEIMDEYNETEKRIRSGIMVKSKNSLAFRKLSQDLDQGAIAYRERTRTTAANWAVDDSNRSFRESFRVNLANNRFEAADQDLVAAVKVGAVSAREQNQFAMEVLAKRQYRTGEILIEGIQAETHSLEQVHELHRVFDEGENYVHLMPTQKAALHSKLNYKLQDMMSEDVAYLADHFSVEDAEDAINSYMDRRWDQSGFNNERAYTSAIGHLWTVVNQRRARNVKNQKEIDINMRVMEIMAGGRADPKETDDKKAMDIVFDIRVAQAQIQEGSPEWIRMAGEQLRTQGWFPPKVESFARASLLHGDPQSVQTASKLIAYADRHAGRSLDWVSKKDIATASLINELTDAGISDADAFNKVREGIERLDEPTRTARQAAYDSDMSKHSYAVLEERIDDMDGFWGDTEIPPEMIQRYDSLRRINYQLTGHKEVADNMAFNEVMRTYAITNRSGDKMMERLAPEAILTDAPQEKVVEYVEDEFTEIVDTYGLDRENIRSVHILDNAAEDAWFLWNMEEGEVVTNEEGQILKWQPNYAESRIGRRDILEAEYKRIEEELEVERELQAYEAKMGRYEAKPEDLRPIERIQRDIDKAGDTVKKDIRTGVDATVEAIGEVPDFFIGTWKATREPREGRAEDRARHQMYLKHERIKYELNAQPGSKLEAKIQRLQTIEEELEKLE